MIIVIVLHLFRLNRMQRINVSVLWLALSLVVRRLEGVCEKPGKFSFHTEKLHYCDAHELCLKEGQAVGRLGTMVGQCVDKYLEQNTMLSSTWINLHALHSHTSDASESSWIYGDTGRSRSAPEMIHQQINETEGDLDGHRVAIITKQNIIVRRGTKSDKHSVLCQIVALPNNHKNRFVEKFVQASLPTGDSWLKEKKWSGGCFSIYVRSTKIMCAMRCHVDLKCRSFYHNFIDDQCITSNYVDSLLGDKYGQKRRLGWIKFPRPG
ncbi:hypothetical protein FGIG_01410 [Fasciola gigantica]|uniref:Apple domain-containing protein n=1 Tax=Fasciola gigantica TaxID=46835 RepID=A0A504YXI9_FASGI|nr:hypothetical protein FGIG_01410 [Fasciola gigantica]